MSDIKFIKLTPFRLFEQIVDQIREPIFSGEFQPGDKLPPEEELKKQFNVGRSSIREALRVLEYEGLVEVRRGSGTFVTNFSGQNGRRNEVAQWLEQREDKICDMLQLREYLEGLSASLVAQSHNLETMEALKQIIDETRTIIQGGCIEDNYRELVRVDSQFHLTISKASGNNLVFEIISYLIPAFQESNKAVIYMGASQEQLLVDHSKILGAIEGGDPREAENAMRSHIVRVRNVVHNISSSVQENPHQHNGKLTDDGEGEK